MKKLLLLTDCIVLLCAGFFLAPRPTGPADEYWGSYAQVTPRLGFVINGDSREYLAAAKEPGRLLQDKEVRQSRPLYVLLAAGLGHALAPMLAGVSVAHWGGIAAETPDFLPYYAAYVLLNLAGLLLSLYLFIGIHRLLTVGHGDKVVLAGLSVFLVANPIAKAFFWTAHQQMFTFLTPLLVVYGLLHYRNQALGLIQSTGGALALGLLPLVYGNFVLLLPALLWHLWATRAGRSLLSAAAQLLLAAAAFVLPTLLWIGLLKLRGVTYYNHEAVRFHQLTWLVETAQAHTFWSTLGTNLLTFGLNLRAIAGFLLAPAALALLPRRQPAPAGAWRVLGFTLGLFAAFYALLGYYPERLTFTLVPVLLLMLALLLHQVRRPQWRWAVPAAALGWYLYVVLSYGPFS